jgi:hypothetical protein
MVTMFAPDGQTTGQIPQENMSTAVAAGGRLAVNFVSPGGQGGYIPLDKVHEAIAAGGHINDAVINSLTATDDLPAIGQGVAKSAINTMRGAADIMGGEGTAERVGIPNVDTEAKSGYEMAGKALETGLEVGAPSVEGASRGVAAAKGAIPSAERSGQAFRELEESIGDHPVGVDSDLSKSVNELKKSVETTNTNLPPVVRKLIDRLDPFQGAGDLTYKDARAFSSELGHFSVNDNLSMTNNTKRLVGNLDRALSNSIQNTANMAGEGEKLASTMKEYHNAMRISGLSDKAKSYALKAALGVTGWTIYKELFGAKEGK